MLIRDMLCCRYCVDATCEEGSMGRSAIFWLITRSWCRSSSKRGVALFKVVASVAHAWSVTVVAGVVSTSALLLEVRLVALGCDVRCVRRY
jgi:hypothetical protein